MKTSTVLLTIILGGVSATVPVLAADSTMKAGNPGDYSDRDRMKSSADEKKQIEEALKTGEEKDFYRRELEKMGWQITAVNYNKPDYLEYEIVKAPSTYEVQLDFDTNSRKSNKVSVTYNGWKADATNKSLKANQDQARR